MAEAMSDDKQLSQCDEEEDYGAASLVKLEAAVEAMGAVAKLKTELDDRRSAIGPGSVPDRFGVTRVQRWHK